MTTTTYVCSACTTGSIAGLGMHKGPEDAMIAFLKVNLLSPTTRYSSRDVGKFHPMDAFWVFTAGPEEPGHSHSKTWVKYGTEFAAYIVEQGLGAVATLPAKINTKYHPDTTCQTWLWSPDQEACEAWWEKMEAEGKIPKPKKWAAGGKVNLRQINITMETECPRCEVRYGDHDGWVCPDGGEWPEY